MLHMFSDAPGFDSLHSKQFSFHNAVVTASDGSPQTAYFCQTNLLVSKISQAETEDSVQTNSMIQKKPKAMFWWFGSIKQCDVLNKVWQQLSQNFGC